MPLATSSWVSLGSEISHILNTLGLKNPDASPPVSWLFAFGGYTVAYLAS